MKKFKNLTYLTLASATAVGVSSCGKYEDGPNFSLRSKKSRVVGDWNVKSIGSQVYADQNQNGIDYGYTINLEFDKNGSVLTSTTYSYGNLSYSYSYAGDWDFSENKEHLLLTIGGNTDTLEIKRLTNTEMWLDDDYTDADGDVWKLEAK